jgi:membrane protein YqaA with SNARE-associated domain
MMHLPALAATASMVASKKSALRWLIHLGGPGLILLGLLDNSVIPLPGSMDVITIVLAAHRRQPWFYYTIMATAGAVLGGYLTYRMARKGGKEMLESRISKKKATKIYALFEKWGFAAVAIPALLPPPFPIVAMLLAAGAMQYPTKKFLAALAVGRGIRYAILAYLGYHYGRSIVKFFAQYYIPTLIILIAFSVIAGLYGLFQYKRRQKPPHPGNGRTSGRVRHRAA